MFIHVSPIISFLTAILKHVHIDIHIYRSIIVNRTNFALELTLHAVFQFHREFYPRKAVIAREGLVNILFISCFTSVRLGWF